MKHWLKRALATAALASGAMIATAGMASASSGSPLPVDAEAVLTQTQEATNNNQATQTAEPSVETNQVNVYAPIAVLSHGSNNGEVDQSNEADTTVVATNENGTVQTIDQDQTAGDDRGGCGKCGAEGESSQTQTAENNNTTTQNANPNVVTNQSNEIGSDSAKPGAASTDWKGYDEKDRDDDDVEQSNEAETTVVAINRNGAVQTIDQDQTTGDWDSCGKCGSEGGSQPQTAENNNTTTQNANPNVVTNQSNEIGSDQAESWTASTNWKGYEPGHGRSGAEQSNEAETTVIAINENGTVQSIDQDQTTKGRDDRDHKDKDDRDHKDKDDRDHKDKDDRDHKDKDDRDHKDKDDRDHKDKDDRDHKDKDDRDHKDKDDRDHKDKDDRDHKDKDDRDHKDKDDRDHKGCRSRCAPKCGRSQSHLSS